MNTLGIQSITERFGLHSVETDVQDMEQQGGSEGKKIKSFSQLMKRLNRQKRQQISKSGTLMQRVRAKLRNASERAVERQKETLYSKFFKHCHEHPKVLKQCSSAVSDVDFCDRFRGVAALSSAVATAFRASPVKRSGAQIALLYNVLNGSKLWSRICSESSSHEKHELCRRMTFRRIHENAKTRTVYCAGDLSDKVYVLLAGRCDILSSGGRVIKQLKPGSIFGELSVVAPGMQRKENIEAEPLSTIPVDLAVIHKRDYTEVVEHARSSWTLAARFDALSKTSPFSDIGWYERYRLVSQFSLHRYDKGSVIQFQGRRAEKTFVVVTGEVRLINLPAKLLAQ